MAKNSTDQFVGMMEQWFSKVPPLPKSWRDFIAMIIPWFALLFGILGVFGSLAAFGILTFLAPVVALSSGVGAASGGMIGALLALVASVLLLAAFPGTKAKKLSGWTFLFWSEVVSVVSAVVAFSVGGVVMGLIGFYIIFQIKSYYK